MAEQPIQKQAEKMLMIRGQIGISLRIPGALRKSGATVS